MTRIVILVVTPAPPIERVISQRKEALVPLEYRRDVSKFFGVSQISVLCFRGGAHAIHELAAYLLDLLGGEVLGVVLLVDSRLEKVSEAFKDICFVNSYPQTDDVESPSNFFGSLFGSALRNFKLLVKRFDEHKYRKMFTLPVRNFSAHELDHLRTTCYESTRTMGFADRLDAALKGLHTLQRPKRYGDGHQVYLIDKKSRCFQLGNERHAQADTAIPPHNTHCILSNSFRFGRRFDSRLHYNVTMERGAVRMDDNYPDCHGSYKPGGSRTHLNMFSNDFF